MNGPPSERLVVRADLGEAEGILVVDSTFRNGSAGGLRVAEDLTEREVATLAREMTLKFAFIGRHAGGAKSGLRVPPGTGSEEKRRLLRELGRHFGPLLRRGVYSAGTDLNCGRDDLAALYAGAGIRLSRVTDTAGFTGLVAAEALRACREHLGGSRPLRVAVEGFGAAAASLAARLPPGDFVFTAVSTLQGTVVNERGLEAPALLAQRARHGDAFVAQLDGEHGDRERVFAVDVDVFVPSARTWSVTAARAALLGARVVAPLANAPYADGAVDALERRGVACLPGFVVNSGGVFASSLRDRGVSLPDLERLVSSRFRPVVAALLRAREESGRSAVEIATEVALERLQRRIDANPPESQLRRTARVLAQELVPRRLSAGRQAQEFGRNLAELEQLVSARGRTSPGPLRGTGTR